MSELSIHLHINTPTSYSSTSYTSTSTLPELHNSTKEIPEMNPSNTKFCRLVIHWLSFLPSSKVYCQSQLCQPKMIICILKLVDIDIVEELMNEDYESIFNQVKHHFKGKSWSRKKLYNYLDSLSFDSLHKEDSFAITNLCLILVEIALNSTGIDVTKLDEEDQLQLKPFLYEHEQLVLMQRVSTLEVENNGLKKRLSQFNQKLDDGDSCMIELETQSEHFLQLKDDEIINLKRQLLQLKQEIKGLQMELNQLNEDLCALLPSLTSTSTSTSTKRTDTVDSDDLIKWEFNVMMDWINGSR